MGVTFPAVRGVAVLAAPSLVRRPTSVGSVPAYGEAAGTAGAEGVEDSVALAVHALNCRPCPGAAEGTSRVESLRLDLVDAPNLHPR
jgi:hypothetical protein